MSTIVASPVIGLEQIQRQAFFTLFDGLNTAIDAVAASMVEADQNFALRTGRDYEEVEIHNIEPENFYEGHRPSLIEAPLDKYPNCSVWTDSASSSEESQALDHSQVFVSVLQVEVMVKANFDEGEGTVNKRANRTIEAVHFALMADKTLGGLVSGFSAEPNVDLSEVFVRKERTSYGPEWFWQAGRLQYTVTKTSNIASNSVFNLDYPGIDQS